MDDWTHNLPVAMLVMSGAVMDDRSVPHLPAEQSDQRKHSALGDKRLPAARSRCVVSPRCG